MCPTHPSTHPPLQQIHLTTRPPTHKQARKAPERLNARAREYADAMIQVGAEAQVPTFDLWKALHGDKPEVAATHLIDGLHLNAAYVVFVSLGLGVSCVARRVWSSSVACRSPGAAIHPLPYIHSTQPTIHIPPLKNTHKTAATRWSTTGSSE